MPELTQRNESVEFLSNDVSYNQLQKFWNEMSQEARQRLMRVDKQTMFEKARNVMFCSRCHGFLLEEFSQIVMYGKSSQQRGDFGYFSRNRLGLIANFQNGDGLSNADSCQGDDQDPLVHPWGCLALTRDEALTLLDCYLLSSSVKGIQNVFDNARARERERKLSNPNACGVGGRRWKGPGSRETCAVHNARLPLEKMVDFWSALGKESRVSLLKMKKEDFMERLVYRFDRKKFCKDCRKNVVREFKELKELMRIKKEPGFQCEVSNDTVQADWSHTFIDNNRIYHHFEWAIGSEKGKSDISPFDNVGLSGIVQVNGLDLRGLDACYVTLRAWKTDGDCTEFSVKAHTLKVQQCIHRRLLVCDGFVTITEGESIRDFFKHAEEVVKEDDDLVDNDGNRLDGECSRTQKHAKSPELAREFLLDAATVIFKEQVEKAFRERTARQNAHSVFISFALKLVEECVHVACKETHILEKQMKILEEEAKEKNEEEERKERRKIKEKEKKLRRKERTRKNEKDRDDCSLTNQHLAREDEIEESTVDDEKPITNATGEVMSSWPVPQQIQDKQQRNGRVSKNIDDLSDVSPAENLATSKDKDDFSGFDYSRYSGRKLKNRCQQDTTLKCSVDKSEQSYYHNQIGSSARTISGLDKHPRSSAATSIIKSSGPKLYEKVHCSNRMCDRGDLQAPRCYQHSDYRGKVEPCCIKMQAGQKYICKPQSASLDMSRPSNLANKLTLGDYITSSCGSKKSEDREASQIFQAGVHKCEDSVVDKKQIETGGEPIRSCPLEKSRIHVPAIVPKENVNDNTDVTHMNVQAQRIHVAAFPSHSLQRDVQAKQDPTQTQANASVEKNLNIDISQANDKDFSLFHFGSPFALADAYKSDSLPEYAVGGLSLNKTNQDSKGNLTCNTKDFIEEYNLFASCKGISFPIF
ncbi:uncharacterized protein LOC141689174 isoform X1 [Apium graveolens]|uniref:uncharacterized protein LOC141689174 isoform X1 n=2 Tax=Apium graveolens TaxID=4045 RepID=UPI003D7A26A5